jgi:Fe-S cluster assembly protein SufD
MLLDKKARSVAIPSLEIEQPNVRRAMHSSSVGPIDETQVFYLMSRGLPRELARKFIVLGFLEPVVARIPLAESRGAPARVARCQVAGRIGGAAA